MHAAPASYAPPHHGYADHHHMPPPPAYHYYHQPQPQMMQHHAGSYAPHHPSAHHPYGYPSHMSAPPQIPSSYPPYQQQPSNHAMTLPAIHASQSSLPPSAEMQGRQPDTTGQIQVPGFKPKVTATVWEDEGTICFQVESGGICVARRQDNHMINGTKLLNVAKMTRGRRDGILKTEKNRKVIKIGPMHLKGVWIPYERALDFANKEKITEQLFPLFIHNITTLLGASGMNPSLMPSGSAGRDGLAREINIPARNSQPPAISSNSTSSNPATGSNSENQHETPNSATSGRPGLERAHTYPTPPTNASGTINMANVGSSYEHTGIPTVPGSQQHFVDSKSLPTTPATTPPDNNAGAMHQQYTPTSAYDASRNPYSANQQHTYNVRSTQYGYGKTDMGPPQKVLKDNEPGVRAYSGYEHERAYAPYPPQQTLPSSSPLDQSQLSGHAKNSPHAVPRRSTPQSMATTPSPWPSFVTPQQRNHILPSAHLSYGQGNPATTNGYTVASQPYSYGPASGGSGKRGRDVEDDEDASYDNAGNPKRRRTDGEEAPQNASRPRKIAAPRR